MTQLEGAVWQLAGAVWQFEGGVPQFARAETREGWALAPEAGVVSRTAEILAPPPGHQCPGGRPIGAGDRGYPRPL